MHLKLSALILLPLRIVPIWRILVLLFNSQLLTHVFKTPPQPVALVTIRDTLQTLTAGNQLAGMKEIVIFLNSAAFMRKEIASH